MATCRNPTCDNLLTVNKFYCSQACMFNCPTWRRNVSAGIKRWFAKGRCPHCGRCFKNGSALEKHLRHCKPKVNGNLLFVHFSENSPQVLSGIEHDRLPFMKEELLRLCSKFMIVKGNSILAIPKPNLLTVFLVKLRELKTRDNIEFVTVDLKEVE